MANLEVKEKNGNIVYQYDFNSLDDFLNELITKKINHRIFPNPASIQSDYGFTRTKSFEEAWNLCKYTYDDGYKKFSELVNHIQFKFENTRRYVNTYKPVGSSVSVPRFLFGIPNNMHSKELVMDKPIINLYFQYSYSCNIEESQIKNRGILTLALINYLENIKNYNVIFNFFSICENENELIHINIKLKNKDEKLKVKRCYFPLVHPSFLRRLDFRADEIIPYLKTNWSFGYGRPLTYEEAKKYIDEGEFDMNRAIYISTPDELGIYGNNIEEDAKRFIDNINQRYEFLKEDEKEKTYAKRR